MSTAAHAAFGASNASRYMACPGSHQLIASLPEQERRSSPHALAGTACHQVVSRCLLNPKQRKSNLLPGYIEEVEDGERTVSVIIDADMLAAIRHCIAHADAWYDSSTYRAVEERFTLAQLDPGAPMFGTADHVVVRPAEELLVVTDWKFGVGHRVVAKGNPQLRYYGLGALLSLRADTSRQVQRIRLEVVQPRLPEGPVITYEELSLMELLDWAEDLMWAVRRALTPGAELVPGEDQCRWCPAAAHCPALKELTEQAVAQQFRDNPPDLPDPAGLTGPELAAVLERAGLARLWLDRVEQLAVQRLRDNGIVPGWKLVHGQSRRVWLGSETETITELLEIGLGLDAITSSKLLSPTQVEKLLAKPDRERIAGLVTRSTPNVVLAPVGDKRPAVSPGEGLFPENTIDHQEN